MGFTSAVFATIHGLAAGHWREAASPFFHIQHNNVFDATMAQVPEMCLVWHKFTLTYLGPGHTSPTAKLLENSSPANPAYI